MNIDRSINLGVNGLIRPMVWDRRAQAIVHMGEWQDNLITDAGMDMPASYSWSGCSRYGYASNDETDPTVADTTLAGLIQQSDDYLEVESLRDGNTVSFRRRITMPEVTEPTVITKIGTAPTLSATANMFSINKLAEPITLTAGQRLLFDRITRVSVSPYLTPAAGTLDGLLDADGNAISGAVHYRISPLSANHFTVAGSGTSASGLLEPANIAVPGYHRMCLTTHTSLATNGEAALELVIVPSDKSSLGDQYMNADTKAAITRTLGSYVAGSHSRSATWLADLSVLNTTWTLLSLARYVEYPYYHIRCFECLLDTWETKAATKKNVNRLTLNLTLNWGRA